MVEFKPFVNLHTHHLEDEGREVIKVVSLMAGQELRVSLPSFYTIGIHPWQLLNGDAKTLQDLLESDLQLFRPIALGEAGLDRSIPVPLPLQQQVLAWQEQLAQRYKLPMVLHIVRAFDLLFARPHSGIKRIVHGYSGKTETTAQLLRAGFYLSFGHALFDESRPAAASLRMVPPERLFLETDESQLPIDAIYSRAAFLRGETEEALRKNIFANFADVFNLNL